LSASITVGLVFALHCNPAARADGKGSITSPEVVEPNRIDPHWNSILNLLLVPFLHDRVYQQLIRGRMEAVAEVFEHNYRRASFLLNDSPKMAWRARAETRRTLKTKVFNFADVLERTGKAF